MSFDPERADEKENERMTRHIDRYLAARAGDVKTSMTGVRHRRDAW